MEKNVYLEQTDIFAYNNTKKFNPSHKWPEALNLNIKSDEKVYESIRNLLYQMGLDKENFGTKEWNPFKEFIKKDDHVVIKPNLVKHENELIDGGTDCLITNFSVIRPLIDYTLLAIGDGKGNLIVGDAPVQECIFDEVVSLYGLEEAIEIYNSSGYGVKLMDFRKNNNVDLECQIVSLGEDSSLAEVDQYAKKYAITNYNLKYMHQHHQAGIHEYLIPKLILNADVIINVPKPKTHRKAGMTACMKNFVGINSKKEYLPHHRNGSISSHGDEYPEKSPIKALCSNLKNYTYLQNKAVTFLNRGGNYIQKKMGKSRFLEGSWYGNDTIWRTILDINKIVLYADKTGILKQEKQRTVFNVADMIVSGEKEGPLLPSPKPVGILVAGFNSLNVDKVISQIMGFDYRKIKYIENGYQLKKYVLSSPNFETFSSGRKIEATSINKKFIPTDGWIDYLYEK